MPSWFALPPERPLAIAHRGASAVAAENSLAAFAAAIALGAFAIETDLRLTRDGHLVCHHDADLVRTAGFALPVAEATLDTLQRATSGRLCTFAAACAAIDGRAALLLDLKRDDAAFHAAVIAALRARGRRHDVALGVRSLAQFDSLGLALPWMPTVGLLGGFDDLLAFAGDGGTVARLWEGDVTADRVATLRGFGAAVCVMAGAPTAAAAGTMTPARLARLRAIGPDAIMLDDPRLLRQAAAASAEAGATP